MQNPLYLKILKHQNVHILLCEAKDTNSPDRQKANEHSPLIAYENFVFFEHKINNLSPLSQTQTKFSKSFV